MSVPDVPGAPPHSLLIWEKIKILRELPQSENVTLNQTILDALQIKVRNLDIDGQPSNGGTQFIEVMPWQEAKRRIDEYKPWLFWDFTNREYFKDIWEANWTCVLLATWFSSTENDNKPERDGLLPLHETAGWESIPWEPACRKMAQDEDQSYIWAVKGGLVSRDKSKPHVTLLLIDRGYSLRQDIRLVEKQVENDKLLWSEVWTILNYLLTRAADLDYQDHRATPVTLISCTGTRGRIVQGYMGKDPNNGEHVVNIQKTNFISLDLPHGNDQENFMRVFGWMAGKPIGDTLNDG
ncbi:hypothetical protein F5B20DRAFT_521969 [Whalleya microplaca]|nr:hypothetical protein F5B20DRAFT_521969 [Whalleya microplaca]